MPIESMQPRRTSPPTSSPAARTRAARMFSPARISRPPWARVSPAGVSLAPWFDRSISLVPMARSSSWMWRDRVGWVSPRARAAALTEPVSAMATRAARAWGGRSGSGDTPAG